MQLNSYLCLSLTSYKHSHTLSNCCCHINTLTGSETAAVLCPEALDIRPYGLLWVGHMWGFRQGSGDLELRGSQGKYYKPIHSDSEKIHTVFQWWGFLFSFFSHSFIWIVLMFKHGRVYIAVTNHLSFSLFSQIWPCSWTKESLSTMVPAGEHSSSTPVFSSFRSVPSLPLHSSLKLINYSLSHLISDCQKRPQLLSFPKTNECFREGSSSSLGSHLSLPLSLVVSMPRL